MLCGTHLNTNMTPLEKIIHTVGQLNLAITTAKQTIIQPTFTDKSIPLSERWIVWSMMPEKFKEVEPFVTRFNAFKHKLAEGTYPRNLADDHILGMVERHRLVTADYIDTLIQNEIELSQQEGSPGVFTEDDLTNFREEILERNLHGFINDW